MTMKIRPQALMTSKGSQNQRQVLSPQLHLSKKSKNKIPTKISQETIAEGAGSPKTSQWSGVPGVPKRLPKIPRSGLKPSPRQPNADPSQIRKHVARHMRVCMRQIAIRNSLHPAAPHDRACERLAATRAKLTCAPPQHLQCKHHRRAEHR